ncbi:hypothetical protein [Nesterenkonia sp. CF4.4]|uniref:hypothetical protein n=1 Tax=Nesterenkonia sp. CF4.4 TaxID=3373079 RepID=UPI003EE5302A
MSENQTETGKFYTASRHFQQVIGVFHDGTAIPGGPYTVTQFIVAVAVLAGGFVTRGIWAVHWIPYTLLVVGIAWAAVWVTGKLPTSRRSPLNTLNSISDLLKTSRYGMVGGREFPRRKFGVTFTPSWKKQQDKQEKSDSTKTADQGRVIVTGFGWTDVHENAQSTPELRRMISGQER